MYALGWHIEENIDWNLVVVPLKRLKNDLYACKRGKAPTENKARENMDPVGAAAATVAEAGAKRKAPQASGAEPQAQAKKAALAFIDLTRAYDFVDLTRD